LNCFMKRFAKWMRNKQNILRNSAGFA
jgi:hypothetical protein